MKLPFPASLCAVMAGLLMGCAAPGETILAADEARLATGGDLAKYHYLVRQPYSLGLNHEGFIVGIEKTPKGLIGYPFGRNYDDKRFKLWDETPGEAQYLEARNAHFKRVTSDPKSVFVSHILEYGFDAKGTVRFDVRPLYTAYRSSGFAGPRSDTPCVTEGGEKKEYVNSWKALDCLKVAVDKMLAAAGRTENPYTHLIVASMGWNNDQVESVRRYNALAGNLISQARLGGTAEGRKFNPLIIGLTWPSVWGGDSFFNTVNLFAHLISYPNKADDADEIGYTIANYLVNKIVGELKRDHGFKTVLIGHSFGARIISRAMFSAHLLNVPPKVVGEATDLMLNLQGAYSIRRYKENHRLPFPASLFSKGEGSPYLMHKKLSGKTILTWSIGDTANPLAQFVTGAAHAGGEAGYEESLEMKETFTQLEWVKGTKIRPDCAAYRDDGKILMVNANSFVKDHNDILDQEMGDFIWQIISCFTYPR